MSNLSIRLDDGRTIAPAGDSWRVETKSGRPPAGPMRFSGFGGQSMGGSQTGGMNAFLRPLLPGAHYDYEAEAGALWKNSAVAICLGWLRKNAPEPRLKVEVRKGSEWVDNPDHEVLQDLEEPNEGYEDDTLWAATYISLFVDGNAYWVKDRAPSGRQAFWYAPHWEVQPRWPTSGKTFISHYERVIDGQRFDIPKKDVIHFRMGIDPENDRLGMAELKTALREVCTDNEANSYTAALLRNMGIVGAVISPEHATDEISTDDADDLKQNWKEKFTGENRGKPLVNSVRLNIQKIGLTPEEMVLDKIRQIPEARICAAIGLPGMVVGLTVGDTQRTFSNLGEANRHAYENCLMPVQKTTLKQFQRQNPERLRPRRVERLVHDYSNVQALREDQTELSKRTVVEYQGGVSDQNEARVRLGYKPVAGGDGKFVTAPVKGMLPVLGDNRVEGESE